MIEFLHTYYPSPILLQVGPFTIYWYGLFYAISIALGYWLVASTLKRIISTNYPLPTTHSTAPRLNGLLAPQSPVTRDEVGRLTARLPEFSFGLIISGLVGGRLYHVLNEWSYYWAHPLQILAVWNGGLAIHGALIAGLIYLWWYSHNLEASSKQRIATPLQTITHYSLHTTYYLFLLDLISPAVLLGQAIGRWGNYFNQELFGYPTSFPWGIPISSENRPPEFAEFTYFHPTFLYESLWDFVGFIILIILQRRLTVYLPREAPPNVAKWSSKITARPGFIFSFYLIWMSLGRIIVELIRVDRTPLFFGWRLPLMISLIILITSVAMLLVALTRSKKWEYN